MLYNAAVGLPATAETPQTINGLRFSYHALKQAQARDIHLPTQIIDAKVVELEIIDGKVTKVVYRMRYDAKRDIIIVIIPQTKLVKTVYLNHHKDQHKTLDTSKYAQV